jgi:hypothetical protein
LTAPLTTSLEPQTARDGIVRTLQQWYNNSIDYLRPLDPLLELEAFELLDVHGTIADRHRTNLQEKRLSIVIIKTRKINRDTACRTHKEGRGSDLPLLVFQHDTKVLHSGVMVH